MDDNYPTTQVSVTDLDQGTDSPKAARLALLDGFNKLNQMVRSLGSALGICPLDANAKVPSTNLTAAVDHAAIQDNAVEGDNIKEGVVSFLHLTATITNDPTAPTGGVDGDFHFIYD